MLPFFLEQVRELRAAADELRARGARDDDPVLGLWREAACCQVLFAAGRHEVALARLRMAFRAVTGFGLVPPSRSLSATEAHAVAAGLFAWCRAALDHRTAA